MASEPVLVSIGVPVFNGEQFLAESLDSLLAQDFPWFELLISDNASTDSTEEICRAYAAQDPRVRYERLAENQGAAANYNRLVHQARGKYFKWAAYDDICAPTFLSRCFRQLESKPDAVLVYPRTFIIDERSEITRTYEDRLQLDHDRPRDRLARLARNVSLCNPCFGLIRHGALLQTGLIGSYPSSDVTLLGQLALLGKFDEVPDRLFYRRIHADSSRQGRHSLAEAAEWFDPNHTRRPVVVHPRYRVMGEITRSITRSRLPMPQRAACALAYVGTFLYRRLRISGNQLKSRATRLTRATTAPAGGGHSRTAVTPYASRRFSLKWKPEPHPATVSGLASAGNGAANDGGTQRGTQETRGPGPRACE